MLAPASTRSASSPQPAPDGAQPLPEHSHFDVVVMGAGVSGISAASMLRQRFPEKTFVLFEAMESFGGTWHTHQYPGIRTDSDMFTYGFADAPWSGDTVATGAQIQSYLGQVIARHALAPLMHYRHRIVRAAWCSQARRWTLSVTDLASQRRFQVTTDFLWACTGYYDHDHPYRPHWKDEALFRGPIIHPQQWPQDLDYQGKQVVVIGSGATAATLIPALAQQAAHVVMLQRSPTFFFPKPAKDALAEMLEPLNLPPEWVHEIMRRHFVQQGSQIIEMSAHDPQAMRQYLLETIRPLLPEGFDLEKHFSPSYRPWQQRIAVVPDGDLFQAIRAGTASVVTDKIARLTADGVVLESGQTLAADIIVSATGLNMNVFGNIDFQIDGEFVDFSNRVTWRGLMISGIPNMAYHFGYFRSSWTLRVELANDFVARLWQHMAAQGHKVVQPELDDPDGPTHPWVSADNVNAGYMMRANPYLWKQGEHPRWQHFFEYEHDLQAIPAIDVAADGLMYQ